MITDDAPTLSVIATTRRSGKWKMAAANSVISCSCCAGKLPCKACPGHGILPTLPVLPYALRMPENKGAEVNVLPFGKPTKRIRDTGYMAAVRLLPCCAAHYGGCEGAVEADHASRNHGSNRKGDDLATIPLCHRHHMQRHNWSGPFKQMSGAQMLAWCTARITETQSRVVIQGGAL